MPKDQSMSSSSTAFPTRTPPQSLRRVLNINKTSNTPHLHHRPRHRHIPTTQVLPRRRWRRTLGILIEILGELLILLKRPLAQQADHVLPAQHLLAQQLLRHDAYFALLLRQQVAALVVGFVDDAADLMVDVARRFLREGLVQLLLVLLEVEVADLGGHAPFRDHGGGHARYFVEVVARAAGHGLEMEFLADSPRERHRHAVHQLVDVQEVDVALGEELGVAESALAARDDANFQEGVGAFEEPAADGMAGFVVGDGAFFFGVEDGRFFLEAADDALDGLFEVVHYNFVGGGAGSWGMSQ